MKKKIIIMISAFVLLSSTSTTSFATCSSTTPKNEQIQFEKYSYSNDCSLDDEGLEIMIQNISDTYKNEYNEYSEKIDSIIKEYYEDEEFISEFKYSPNSAMDTLINSLNIEMGISSNNFISPLSSTVIGNGLGVLYYCYVDDTITQEKTTWCGVASTLMALTGIYDYNVSGLVSGFDMPTQNEIASEVMGTDSAVVYKIKNYLNSCLQYNKYSYKVVNSSVTKSDITELIQDSLSKNRPVILHAIPYPYMSYYSNMSNTFLGHYLVVEDYNSYSGEFTICDCTYINGYQGRHVQISIDEIYNSLYCPDDGVTGRYIIYA